LHGSIPLTFLFCVILALQNIISPGEMKHLVHTKRRTHQEISDMLKERHPGLKGLSKISIRKFCIKNGIRKRRSFEEMKKAKEASRCKAQVTRDIIHYINMTTYVSS